MRRSSLGLDRPNFAALATVVTASALACLAACGEDGRGDSQTSAPLTTTSPTLSTAGSTGTPDTDPVTDTATPTGEPTSGTTGTDSRGESTGTPDTTTDGVTTGPVGCGECAVGEYCEGDACVPGCDGDDDCSAPTAVCDLADHTCKGCVDDSTCALGTICEAGTCVPGCNDDQPCDAGLACCAGACFDLLTDPLHCGGCDSPCPVPANAAASCTDSMCGLGACDAGFTNCDGDLSNGCEVSGSCQCTPGEQSECYSGEDGTQGVGVCKAGLQTCNPQGTGYGECVGEVLPGAVDLCGNGLDDNCNGAVDEDPDADGDGWTVCGGDCCDAAGPNCLNPDLVNPGAFEVLGNMVDDDCDAMPDNAVPACDAGLPSNSGDPLQYAKAIDLCQFTTEAPAQKDKKWGVISAALSRGNGAGAPDSAAKSIRTGFGTGGIVPQQNSSLAVFSTGNAADQNDNSPNYADFQTGKDNGANSAAPADWLAANGNKFPNAPGCPSAASNQANNSVMLKIRVRVPTNAKSFNVQMYFMSAEWPEWTCTAYNDMFVTLLDSAGAGNPSDKNIAIYATNNQKYPVGVNLVKAAQGLFTQCKNGTYGCSGGNGGTYNGCTGTGQLTGTGMDILEGGCGGNNTTGGGTGWLKMSGNVKGGEIMEIRFAIWDTSDGIYDSLVLLDDWVWSLQASQPGVQPG